MHVDDGAVGIPQSVVGDRWGDVSRRCHQPSLRKVNIYLMSHEGFAAGILSIGCEGRAGGRQEGLSREKSHEVSAVAEEMGLRA